MEGQKSEPTTFKHPHHPLSGLFEDCKSMEDRKDVYSILIFVGNLWNFQINRNAHTFLQDLSMEKDTVIENCSALDDL